MQFQDALRAQYFIRALEQEIKEIALIFSGDLSPFVTNLCRILDQILLPVIAYEMAQAKEEGALQGKTPEERYQSFFIQNGHFTLRAKVLPEKYPFLFTQLDQTLHDSFHNLKLAITRTHQEKEFASIAVIDLLTQSDKHRGQQALLMTFDDTSKWVYKPRDLRPEMLLHHFINHLHLPSPYDLKAPVVLPRKTYGWMKFQPHTACQSKQEIQNYFRRAGVLLSIADTLNYTDGHFENLIASGPYPVLIDGETLFQNYNNNALKKKTVLSTGLIQKSAPNHKKKAYHAAFQASQKETYHILYPHVLQERTDSLQVEFHGYREGILDNLPYIGKDYFLAQDFKDEFLDGLRLGYTAIQKHSTGILADKLWWKTLDQIQARTLMHHTVNYVFLLRRVQQPDACQSKEKAQALIEEKLPDTPYTAYEIRDLLAGNIPYFYHHPGGYSVYNGEGEKYPPHLLETSATQIKRNLQECLGEKAYELVALHLDHAKKTFKLETFPAA